ncbi:O-methyltransferase [Gaeumannomyces tritici R3-111a-1]|uniref:O-methyltransferase n=1 Tax=Gaeumannomyces tritici (strain R3-111a-1) TaxID=644352 RepID=J3P8C1_GAET3|nr:O-methyltransferase [Gaeumannomyces tritici R3-111a-1]EJT72904.1 O-methyltransferase [Gaeumannomyces tritici R3-111a-1]
MAKQEAAKLVALLDGIDQSTAGIRGDDVARVQLRDAAERCLARLQTPYERSWDLAFANPIVFACLQMGMDLGLWEAWRAAGGGDKTLDDIADMCEEGHARPDINLLRRTVRLLAMFSVLEEKGVDRYGPTPFSLEMGDKTACVAQTLECGTDHFMRAGHNLPKYLAKTSYREPLDPKTCNYVDAFGLEFFDRVKRDPRMNQSFADHMAGFTQRKTPWVELFDTGASLMSGAELGGGSPLCVDVGGGVMGVDITHLLKKHPGLPAGALVLQDLPEVVGAASLDGEIKKMAHDIFQPQPVKGSRAYYFHAVFHDWPEAEALVILGHIAAAMRKGYSKLLIYEVMIPAAGATRWQAIMDVGMMSLLSAHERTEAQWRSLLTKAGFSILNFWPDLKGTETLIEAELA